MSPIKGSFRNDKSLNPVNIDLMCRATVRNSVDGIKDEVQKLTPVDTGELREKWKTGRTKKVKDVYTADVSNDADHARAIEYGTAPHRIAADAAQALHFNGVFAKWVMHPGSEGVHMATRGASQFEQFRAERVAKDNVRKFLL